MAESRCGAVAVGWAYLFPPLSSGGASLAQPWLRFHIPLIEPDVQISRIRLSDKASRLRPWQIAFGGSDFAGWGLHPLESAALSRRTPIADLAVTGQKRWNGS